MTLEELKKLGEREEFFVKTFHVLVNILFMVSSCRPWSIPFNSGHGGGTIWTNVEGRRHEKSSSFSHQFKTT